MLQPCFNNILVEVLDNKAAEHKSAGGIILSQKTQVSPLYKGKVLAIGPGYFAANFAENRIPICCCVGDIVYFRPQDFYYLNQVEMGQALVPDTSIMAIECNCKDKKCGCK